MQLTNTSPQRRVPGSRPTPGAAARARRRRSAPAGAGFDFAQRLARGAGTGSRRAYDSLTAVLPRVPVRDLETLRAHHRGLEGEELADALVRNASLAVAAVAAAGSAAALSRRRVPAWLVALPVTLAAEGVAIAAIEAKLLAELHEVYGVPLRPGARSRAVAAASEWAARRELDPSDPRSLKVLANVAMGGAGGRRVARSASRRARVGTVLATGVAGASSYRRNLTELAEDVRRDLRRSPRRRFEAAGWPPW